MKLIYDNIYNYSHDEYKYFLTIIKEEKQKKIKKIINEDDKKRSILGEILLIKLLKEFKIDYYYIDIYKNKYGKPFIKNMNIYFNISHSNDYVVCIISNNEIGIDIEKIRNVKKNIINQFATPNEIIYISESNDNFNQKCYEVFTLKEAYFKCLGTDLSNIKNVEFDIKNKLIKCNDDNFSFKLIYDINNYIIAICEKKQTL